MPRNRNYMTAGEERAIDDISPGNLAHAVGGKLKALFETVGPIGSVFYLDPAYGSDDNDGLAPATAFKTLTKAYAALTTNKNDVLFYIAGSSSISLSATLTWAKSYTHFIGLCSPVGVANRARIFQTSTATGCSPLINVTGSGCVFKNLYVFHGVDDATSLICFQVTGKRNYFENCHFAGFANTLQDTTGAASLSLAAAEENVFNKCFIGLDASATAGALSTEILVSGGALRNRFDECMIYRYITSASHALVTSAALGFDRFMIFSNCLFYTDSANQTISCTSIFSLGAQTQGKIILDARCRMITDGSTGTGDWDSNNRGLIWSAAVAPAGSAAGGICTKQ